MPVKSAYMVITTPSEQMEKAKIGALDDDWIAHFQFSHKNN